MLLYWSDGQPGSEEGNGSHLGNYFQDEFCTIPALGLPIANDEVLMGADFLGFPNAGGPIAGNWTDDEGIAFPQSASLEWLGDVTFGSGGNMFTGVFRGYVFTPSDWFFDGTMTGGADVAEIISGDISGNATYICGSVRSVYLHGGATLSAYYLENETGIYTAANSSFSIYEFYSSMSSIEINGRFKIGGGAWLYPAASPWMAPAADVRDGVTNLGVAGALEVPPPPSRTGIGI